MEEKPIKSEVKPDEQLGHGTTQDTYKNLLQIYPKLIPNDVTLQQLEMLIPGINYRIEEVEHNGILSGRVYIDANNFDEEVAKRFVTFFDNICFNVEAELSEGVKVFISHLRASGYEFVVYKNGKIIEGFVDDDNPNFNNEDPWNCRKIIDGHQNFPPFLVSQELNSIQDIIDWINSGKECDMYLTSNKARSKLRMRMVNNKLSVVFKQFGLNQEDKDKFNEEGSIIFPLARSISSECSVVLGTRINELLVIDSKGNKTYFSRDLVLSRTSI